MEKKQIMDLVSCTIDATHGLLKGRYQIEDIQKPEWLDKDTFEHIKNCLISMLDYERCHPIHSK